LAGFENGGGLICWLLGSTRIGLLTAVWTSKNPEIGSISERERYMAIFEGPDRNRNIIITVVVVVVIAVIIYVYS